MQLAGPILEIALYQLLSVPWSAGGDSQKNSESRNEERLLRVKHNEKEHIFTCLEPPLCRFLCDRRDPSHAIGKACVGTESNCSHTVFGGIEERILFVKSNGMFNIPQVNLKLFFYQSPYISKRIRKLANPYLIHSENRTSEQRTSM